MSWYGGSEALATTFVTYVCGSATTVVLLRNQVSYAVLMVAVAISVGNRATGTAKDIRVTAGVYSQVLSLSISVYPLRSG